MILNKIFEKNRVVAVCGNRNQAKSSLINKELVTLKRKFDKDNIQFGFFVYGIEDNIKPAFEKEGISIIYSKHDILDMKIKDSVIFIDEFADIFPDISSRGKQLEKIKRFFNRLNHNNNFLIIGTAQDKYYNSFMCGLIDVFLVKQIDFDSLVNGTYLKTQVKGLANDDYRLYCSLDTYYKVSKEESTSKHTFTQLKEFDSKRDVVNPFEIVNKIVKKKEKTIVKKKINKKVN